MGGDERLPRGPERDEPALECRLHASTRLPRRAAAGARPARPARRRSCSRQPFSPASAASAPATASRWKIGSIALSTALNIGLFWVGLRLLTARDVSWRSLRGGAIAAGIGYEILQAVGGFYVGHVLTSSSDTYGTFALVIGLLSFVYLAAHVTLLAAEGNVVAARGLWPRSLSATDGPTTEADRQALTALTRAEKRRAGQTIEVEFAGSSGRAQEQTAP